LASAHTFFVIDADDLADEFALRLPPQLTHWVLSELHEQPCALQSVQNKPPLGDFGVAFSCWALAICGRAANAMTAASVDIISLIMISIDMQIGRQIISRRYVGNTELMNQP
jgi:hypothetical protein